jgi:hypothetical protein
MSSPLPNPSIGWDARDMKGISQRRLALGVRQVADMGLRLENFEL